MVEGIIYRYRTGIVWRDLPAEFGPGQGSDSKMFPHLLAAVRGQREGAGRPRTTPDSVMVDKAYSCRAHRALLRCRGITAVIAEPCGQQAKPGTSRFA